MLCNVSVALSEEKGEGSSLSGGRSQVTGVNKRLTYCDSWDCSSQCNIGEGQSSQKSRKRETGTLHSHIGALNTKACSTTVQCRKVGRETLF